MSLFSFLLYNPCLCDPIGPCFRSLQLHPGYVEHMFRERDRESEREIHDRSILMGGCEQAHARTSTPIFAVLHHRVCPLLICCDILIHVSTAKHTHTHKRFRDEDGTIQTDQVNAQTCRLRKRTANGEPQSLAHAVRDPAAIFVRLARALRLHSPLPSSRAMFAACLQPRRA